MKQRLSSDNQSPSDLLTDLKDLVAEAEKLLESSVGDRANDAVESLRTRYDAAQERLSEAYGKAKRCVADGAKRTDENIRENPYQAIAVAVGVGLLAGVLLTRRCSK